MRNYIYCCLALGIVCLHAACSNEVKKPQPTEYPASVKSELHKTLAQIMQENKVNTAGIGVIKNGRLAFSGYYGEQAPGIPASESTRFNIASITKVVTAETILKLVDEGRISLDEPMSTYWIDPDIAGDVRHKTLTPRIALNHTTGFPNWRYSQTPQAIPLVTRVKAPNIYSISQVASLDKNRRVWCRISSSRHWR
jgi:CubicO group peptidase (beta-lactamase class C family)